MDSDELELVFTDGSVFGIVIEQRLPRLSHYSCASLEEDPPTPTPIERRET